MDAIIHHPLFTPILVTLVIVAAFPLVAGYLTLIERKVLADFQVRLGPMRTGPHGLLQPIADALKLLIKEDIIPSGADKSIFWLAPVISTFTGLTAFAVIPFSKYLYVADVNVGLLVISAMSAVGRSWSGTLSRAWPAAQPSATLWPGCSHPRTAAGGSPAPAAARRRVGMGSVWAPTLSV